MSGLSSVPPEILEKIRKCFVLGERSNWEAEAKTAMKMAQGLLEKYGLSRAELDMAPDGHLKKDKIRQTHSKPYWMAPWEKRLSKVPGLLLPVELIFSPTPDNHLRLLFVGTEQDAALAIEIFTILRAELLRISREEPAGISRRSFLLGCADTLVMRGHLLASERAEATKGKGSAADPGRALIVVKGNDVKEYVKNNIETKPVHNRGPQDFDEIAHERGKEAGKHVNLNFQKSLEARK